MKLSRNVVGAAVTLVFALGSTAMAQQVTGSGQPGNTTGPASGTPVEPSTAVQKQNPSDPPAGSAQGSTAVGAPGAAGGPGTQGGPSPGSAPGSVSSEGAQGGVGAGSPGVSAKPGTQGGASPGPASK